MCFSFFKGFINAFYVIDHSILHLQSIVNNCSKDEKNLTIISMRIPIVYIDEYVPDLTILPKNVSI